MGWRAHLVNPSRFEGLRPQTGAKAAPSAPLIWRKSRARYRLVLDRLKAEEGQEAASLAQHLVDAFVEDMDRSVRELGVGDMGVARRVKQMAQALYGRSAVYSAALNDSDPAALDEALRRNLFGTVEAPPADGIAAVARYMREARGTLAATALARLTDGTPVFPEPSAAV